MEAEIFEDFEPPSENFLATHLSVITEKAAADVLDISDTFQQICCEYGFYFKDIFPIKN